MASTLNFEGGKVFVTDNSGNPLAGGKLYFYEINTTTPKDTYTTSEGSVANANPVILDSAGRATVWMTGNYDVVIKDSNDVTIYSFDDTNFTSDTTVASFNLVENGSFENDSDGDGFPDDWVTTEYTGGDVSLDTSTQTHAGQSVKFVSTGTGGGYVISESFIPVSELTTLFFQFELKSTVAGVRNLVQIQWYDSAKASVSTTSVYDDSTTNPTSWTAKSAQITPPATAVYCKVEMYGCHSSDATAGTTWFDNVIFHQFPIFTIDNTFSGANTFSGNNIFSGTNTHSGTSNFTGAINSVSTDAGAGAGPAFTAHRNSASPAASDVIGQFKYDGEDDGSNQTTYAETRATILDPTGGSEDGDFRVRTIVAGTEADRVIVGQGIYTPGTTGTDKGAKTINVSDIFDDGVQVPPVSSYSVVTGSRSFNTTYQNTTGHPIHVIVTGEYGGSGTDFDIKTDGSSPPTTQIAQMYNNGAAGDSRCMSFWVQDNDYYRIDCTSGTVNYWVETT